ncbi:hypothetical protein MA16_Dca001171 [Dendrobium catenatum]|uniref:Endonuclease/exonuclease/phosphatase domain-containing protein n=1 Tax=Dendrobium catenatum TaxID=906689 RepID=A0A2I0WLN1_9ASPA|nr:hypothetical protein MA16_Dca001171 [Dendrobium catenatum]
MSFPPMAAWNIRGFNHPDKVFACKRLIQSFKLDLVCILENRINVLSLQDPFFESSHSLFPNEASCHNFALSSSGRIWIKWNASKICFKTTQISSQFITGVILVANQPILLLSAIYASNNPNERRELWEDITQSSPSTQLPWALIGDYNCCRYASDKLGGSPISMSSLSDFNSMIFQSGLKDLNSVGLKYSWFNQQTDNPIHIKLDRVLVNELWLESFADSYYSVQNPSCSDHCPIILHSGLISKVQHRFLFKNYWTSLEMYWIHLLEIFSKPCIDNPLSHLCNSLRMLKGCIKKEAWYSSNGIKKHLDGLLSKQNDLLGLLQQDHNNLALNLSYKEVNSEIANFNSMYSSWIVQRAKVNWLKKGEDDLKFLFAKIRSRRGGNKSLVNLLSSNPFSDRSEVINNILNYYQNLFNPPNSISLLPGALPIGNRIPAAFASSCIFPVLDDEIKKAVFKGSSNSSPGPDGFNFHFYKSAWHIIGPTVCKAIRSFFHKCYMPNGVKATALVIVPKTKNATTVSEYRPIALCNTIYKIITKVIAERIKPVMKLIVMDTQAGFIKSRVSTDNILLANDILAFAGKNKRGNYFCAKLDIKKSF